MRRTEQNKGRVFLLTFALAALLLSLIMVGTVLAVQPTMPQNHADELPAQEPSYRPAASESLTMAIIGKKRIRRRIRFPADPFQPSIRPGSAGCTAAGNARPIQRRDDDPRARLGARRRQRRKAGVI